MKSFKIMKEELEEEIKAVGITKSPLAKSTFLDMQIRNRKRHIAEAKLSMLTQCQELVKKAIDELSFEHEWNEAERPEAIWTEELKEKLGI